MLDRVPFERDMLAVAFHRQLLQISGEALQVLLVGQHRHGLRTEEIVVPDRQQRPSAPAGCARTVRCGNAHPSRESRPAWRGNCPGRWRAWSTGRWPNPSNSARRPNPRTRTCWPYRCRTSPPLPRWSRPRQNVWRRPFRRRPRPARNQSRAVWALVIVSSVVKVFEETMNSVSAGSRSRTASAKSVPSTFETNRNVMPRSL